MFIYIYICMDRLKTRKPFGLIGRQPRSFVFDDWTSSDFQRLHPPKIVSGVAHRLTVGCL